MGYLMTSRTRLSKVSPLINYKKMFLLHKYSKPGASVDLGCGNGMYGVWLSSQGGDVTQIDIFDRRDLQAKALRFEEKDLNVSTFGPADYFNNVIAFDIIEHVLNDNNFVAECYRCLKKDGLIFISVPNEDNSLLEPLGLAHIHFTDKTHQREYSSETVLKLLRDNKFKLISIMPQYNDALITLPLALAKESYISRFLAKCIIYFIHVLLKFRIFNNRIVADWLVVAQK